MDVVGVVGAGVSSSVVVVSGSVEVASVCSEVVDSVEVIVVVGRVGFGVGTQCASSG